MKGTRGDLSKEPLTPRTIFRAELLDDIVLRRAKWLEDNVVLKATFECQLRRDSKDPLGPFFSFLQASEGLLRRTQGAARALAGRSLS